MRGDGGWPRTREKVPRSMGRRQAARGVCKLSRLGFRESIQTPFPALVLRAGNDRGGELEELFLDDVNPQPDCCCLSGGISEML